MTENCKEASTKVQDLKRRISGGNVDAEESLESRLEDRRQWIAKYRSRLESDSVDLDAELRVADRRLWIAAWRERSSVKVTVGSV